jgi:hypothetical protein
VLGRKISANIIWGKKYGREEKGVQCEERNIFGGEGGKHEFRTKHTPNEGLNEPGPLKRRYIQSHITTATGVQDIWCRGYLLKGPCNHTYILQVLTKKRKFVDREDARAY